MNDHARELRRYAPLLGRPTMMLAAADEIERLAAKLEAAEKERDALRAELAQLHKEADKFGDDIDWIQRAMQAEAKIKVMEKQEPAYWGPKRAIEGTFTTVIAGKFPVNPTDTPLYALPGAKGEEK